MKALFFAVLLSLATVPAIAAEWYENGSLHGESALVWQEASDANKLATAGDLIASSFQNDMLIPEISSRIRSVDDIRPLAEELVNQLDAAFEPEDDPSQNRQIYANQKVNETAAMLLIMMGWVDLG
ncbi:hypothetical protein KUW18_16720 [Halomonas sp. DP5Y7-2]|uniref:hypothetical protein n=1 Tax=Halomonas sp. DP5Y7-2 TaxID=2859076 RepID=UPI001C98F67A|nr:hypothetical protein [Halomonas sp. DP5Y7-2]MBY5985738.1 hypothetical protein [Halomonas sp. DP5Y7-2]